jgi:hypothetical protein
MVGGDRRMTFQDMLVSDRNKQHSIEVHSCKQQDLSSGSSPVKSFSSMMTYLKLPFSTVFHSMLPKYQRESFGNLYSSWSYELWPEIPVVSTNKTPFVECIIPLK